MGIFDNVLAKQQERRQQPLFTDISQEGFTDKISYIFGLQRKNGASIVNKARKNLGSYVVRLEKARKALAKADEAPLITNFKVLKPWHALFNGRANPKEINMYYQCRTRLYCNEAYEEILLNSTESKGNWRYIVRVGIYDWYAELVQKLSRKIALHPLDKKILDLVETDSTWYLLPHNLLSILYYGTLPSTWSTDQLGIFPCGILGDEMNVARITNQVKDGFWNKVFLSLGAWSTSPIKAAFGIGSNLVLTVINQILTAGSLADLERLIAAEMIQKHGATANNINPKDLKLAADISRGLVMPAFIASVMATLFVQTVRCINVTRRKFKSSTYNEFRQYENIENMMGDIEEVINMANAYENWSAKLLEDYMRVQPKFDKIASDLEEQNYVSLMSTLNIEFETLVNGYVNFIKEFTEMIESGI